MQHLLMGVAGRRSNFEHNGIEYDQARLLEEATAELVRPTDRHRKDQIGERRERALRFARDKHDFCTFSFGDAGEMNADGRLARTGDQRESITRPDGWSCRLADEMRRPPHMHETHRGHLRRQPRPTLAREEPASRRLSKAIDEALESQRVDALKDAGYFVSDGQPRPGWRNR